MIELEAITARKTIQAINQALGVLQKPIPQTVTEWADENFYLSSESSYTEGRWETMPFQVAILNAMGNDDIQTIDCIKSARVGYTKMVLAAQAYFVEHKKRNQMLFQPTDQAATEFMKEHFEPMIRDVPKIKALSPWYGIKHRDSTKDRKLFSNQKQVHIKGGASAKNYREKSVDVVIFDELSGFESNIEHEGSPTTLGDKRTEGSVFRKSIRGSTPKIKDVCLISIEADHAQHFFRRYVPCPECGEMQTLKFGGKETHYGLKWNKGAPESVIYCCEHCQSAIHNNSLSQMDAAGVWRSDQGLTTKDGIHFRHTDSDEYATPPRHIAFHIWTIYSPWTTWSQIIQDWEMAQGDSDKLKTFINTTLGEAWEEETGDYTEPSTLQSRLEDYRAQDLEEVALVAGIDTQDNRLEATVYAFNELEEAWAIEHVIIPGDTSQLEVFHEIATTLSDIGVQRACIDSGGHSTDTVYKFCKDKRWIVPIKGVGGNRELVEAKGKRRQRMRSRAKKGVAPEPLGVDTGKALLASRLAKTEPGTGFIHFRDDPSLDDEFFAQLTSEVLIKERKGGRVTTRWKQIRERNEALDCFIYALAALRMLVQDGGAKFVTMAGQKKTMQVEDRGAPVRKRKRATPSNFVNSGGLFDLADRFAGN